MADLNLNVKDEKSQLKALEDLYKQRRFSDALIEARRMKDDFPRSFHIRFLYVKILKEVNRLAEAEDTLREMLLIYPNNLNVLLELGKLFVQRTKFEEALEQYNKILFLDPFNSEAKAAIDRINLIKKNQAPGEKKDVGFATYSSEKIHRADTLPEFDSRDLREITLKAKTGPVPGVVPPAKTVEKGDVRQAFPAIQPTGTPSSSRISTPSMPPTNPPSLETAIPQKTQTPPPPTRPQPLSVFPEAPVSHKTETPPTTPKPQPVPTTPDTATYPKTSPSSPATKPQSIPAFPEEPVFQKTEIPASSPNPHPVQPSMEFLSSLKTPTPPPSAKPRAESIPAASTTSTGISSSPVIPPAPPISLKDILREDTQEEFPFDEIDNNESPVQIPSSEIDIGKEEEKIELTRSKNNSWLNTPQEIDIFSSLPGEEKKIETEPVTEPDINLDWKIDFSKETRIEHEELEPEVIPEASVTPPAPVEISTDNENLEFVTESAAELYLKQKLFNDALSIYQKLYVRHRDERFLVKTVQIKKLLVEQKKIQLLSRFLKLVQQKYKGDHHV